MNTHIYKYIIWPDKPTIMPVGAQILSVGWQRENIVCWALVDIEAYKVKRRLVVYGTGHDMTGSDWTLPFIGTVFTSDATFVFHIFDGGEIKNDPLYEE